MRRLGPPMDYAIASGPAKNSEYRSKPNRDTKPPVGDEDVDQKNFEKEREIKAHHRPAQAKPDPRRTGSQFKKGETNKDVYAKPKS